MTEEGRIFFEGGRESSPGSALANAGRSPRRGPRAMGMIRVATAIVVAVATTVAVALSGARPLRRRTLKPRARSGLAPPHRTQRGRRLAISHAKANSRRAANACHDDQPPQNSCPPRNPCLAPLPSPARRSAAAGCYTEPDPLPSAVPPPRQAAPRRSPHTLCANPYPVPARPDRRRETNESVDGPRAKSRLAHVQPPHTSGRAYTPPIIN